MATKLSKEIEYFELRKAGKIYVTKSFPYFHVRGLVTNEKRYVKKVFEKELTNEFVEVEGEIILKEFPVFRNKYQVSAIVYSRKDINLMEFTLQRFTVSEQDGFSPIKDVSFSFTQDEFTSLLKFLSDLKFLDYSNKERFVIDENSIPENKILLNLSKPDPSKVLVDKDLGELVNQLSKLKNNEREALLETLKNTVLTKADLDILTGRKDGLTKFRENLKDTSKLSELEWQKFFKNNSWIFGYGLDYKFLNILQKEASVSSTDLDGKNEVKLDFLLADNNFTVIVELKRPDTSLFDNEKNRSESWRLSKELTYAVSQILSQKAEWEINSSSKNFDGLGNPINQITIDPKAILIIGHSEQFKGQTKQDLIRKKTFELYRRNLRNIEIYTYDELFERAQFIVSDSESNELPVQDEGKNDLPF